MTERVELAHAPQQALMQLLRATAIVALLLGTLGLYGQTSIAVTRQARERAIRCALGASPGRLRSAVVVGGLRFVVIGIPLGLAGSWLQGPLLGAFVYGVGSAEPTLVAGAALALVVVGLAATIAPARRAAAVEPASLLSGS